MAEISKITLPSGNTYDIKDAIARELIANGVTFRIAYLKDSVPDVTKIPAGVIVKYNNTDYTGTLTAANADKGIFYFVYSPTQVSDDTLDKYDEYAVLNKGTEQVPDYFWEKLGDTRLALEDLGDLAFKDASDITTSTDTFVKSYPGTTSKLVTTTIKGVSGTVNASDVSHTSKKLATTSVPNVTSAGSASSWAFAMGSGNDAETLIISGSNSVAPTLGTAITAATGSLVATTETTNVGDTVVDTVSEIARVVATADSDNTTVATGGLDANGGGSSVMTGLGTATTASAVTDVSVQ